VTEHVQLLLKVSVFFYVYLRSIVHVQILFKISVFFNVGLFSVLERTCPATIESMFSFMYICVR
jgi:hypothetical protein